MGSGDLNSVPHACRALILPAESQMQVFYIFVCFQSFGLKAQFIFNENLSQNKQLTKENIKLPTAVCIAQVFMAD